ncbi:helix-turn-helix domain-containing protein [Bradyrhizobium mercantei]|uniref:helix-turn-helix domain-containing protein n=1 Tax=Bradyrhizobium mercantei TaxID=1904807 RepID=UPI000976A6E6|nr:helix-turn-helix domain-containing protein [Bradyrhizobium mercantei]
MTGGDDDFGMSHVRAFSSALPADLVRALSWLRGHLSEPVQLDLLAQVADARPRTLETHFKMFLGTTPLGWVRRMRLARARQEFIRRGPDVTVTAVALGNGFSQLGRFAAEYRKAFGELPSATIQRGKKSSTTTFDHDVDEAIRLTLDALPFAFAVEQAQCNTALEKLSRPQELAPNYGLAKAIAGWCWAQRAAHDFAATPEVDRNRASRLAAEAYELAPDDGLTLTLSSGALVLLHELEAADRRLERALAVDPWLAYAWIRRGWMSAYFGDSDGAIRELRIALHLMPFEPLRHITCIGMGCAHFAAERYDRAALWVRSGVEAYPDSHWAQRIAVASVALTGARAEARRMGRQLTRKEPNLTASQARRAWPFTPRFMSCLGDGLEIAGVPAA